jgi:hypothetical protein
MKSFKRSLIIALLLNIFYSGSYASISGAEIGWNCLGGDSFLIKVIVYNDCNGSALGTLPVNIKCQATGVTIANMSLTLPAGVDITPYCNTSCSRCQSSTCSFPYGIKKYEYQGIVNLSAGGSCCNVIISTTYGTRSTAITTGAAGSNFYTEAMLKRCQTPCDNSPVFTNPPVQILCSGQEYNFNHGAKDTDYNLNGGLSDSLTYEWDYPLSAANTTVAYSGSYAYNRSIYFWGFPTETLPSPRGLHLDAHTGDIQFRPMRTEQTVMVLKVNVYRNSGKIAEIRRELLMFVIACSTNNSPVITTPNNVRSKSVCAGQTVSFSFSTSDPNSSDTVRLNWNNGISGATWTTSSGTAKFPTATLTWTPTANDAGKLPHTFTLTAKDNACPQNALTTQHYQVIVNPIPEATITVSDSGCGKFFFDAFPNLGTSPTYKWSSDSFVFSPDVGSVVSHSFLEGHYPYKVVMTAQGCSRTYTDSFYVDTFMSVYLPPDTAICKNTSITVNAQVANVTSPYTLQWGSGDSLFPGDTTLTKEITVTKDTTIWIRARYGTFSCPYAEITIKARPVYSISLPDDTFYCSLNNLLPPKFYPKRTAFGSFKWYKDISPTVVDSDAFLNVFDTGQFTCVATDTFGCITTDSVRVHLNPAVLATAPDTSICLGTYTNLPGDSVSGHTYTYKWLLNSIPVSTSRTLIVSPSATSDYYMVASELLNGITCSAVHLTTVTIKPLPVFKFTTFTKACEFGTPLALDSFVKVNDKRVTNGLWSCKNYPALVSANSFLSQNAAFNTSPGYKLAFGFTDTISTCFKSDTVILPVYPKPAKPLITITGDTANCFGDSVTLTSTAVFPHYNWSTADTTKKIIAKKSGNYKLVVTSTLGCKSDSSVPANIVVYPQISRPVIALYVTDSFIECNKMNGYYDWFYRPDTLPTPIPISDSSRRINPKLFCSNCYFYVIFTDTNGCVSDTSYSFFFYNLSINNRNEASGFVFYPNPAHNKLLIENPGYKAADLMIMDIFGRNISKQKLVSGKNMLDVSTLKPGIYILRLNDKYVYRLVVE